MSENVYTVALIKPDAFRRRLVGAIYSEIERSDDLRIVAARVGRMTPNSAGTFYAEHVGRPYFADLLEFTCSGPIMALQLRHAAGGEGDVITAWRNRMGPSNPAVRPSWSIRGRMAMGCPEMENLVHGSDSPAAADRELQLLLGYGYL